MGRPRIYESVEDLEKVVEEYFEGEGKDKPTVSGLALYLGFADKSTLYEYRDREGFSYPIKRALMMIERYHEEGLSGNNVAGRIFALKNIGGWRDKTETDITTSGEKLNHIEVTVITSKDKHSLPASSELDQKDNG